MRDSVSEEGSGGVAAGPVGLPSAEQVRAWVRGLGGSDTGLSDGERIDLIRGLEVLKCAAEGAQAELACGFDASQRRVAAAAGVRAERQGRGVAAQVALARRESPHRGQLHVGLATVLRREMPCTWAAWRAGRISEWRAMLLARETACLELVSRTRIDEELAGDPGRVEAMGDAELIGQARRWAYRLEPRAFVERRRRAEATRHTRLRAAPETMAVFTALVSVQHGVAMQAVLGREADRLRLAGDPRTRAQLMADLLVRWVTQPFLAHQASTPATPAGPEPTPDTEPTVDVVPDADVEPFADAEPTDAEPEPAADAMPDAEPTSDSEPEPEADAEPATDSEPTLDPHATSRVPVLVNLVVSDRVLYGDDPGGGHCGGLRPGAG